MSPRIKLAIVLVASSLFVGLWHAAAAFGSSSDLADAAKIGMTARGPGGGDNGRP